MTIPTDEQMRRCAARLFNDEGTLEIDSNAVVSRADDNYSHGAYVQAWVWVNDADARAAQKGMP
jgi:hypothetical protein